MTGFNSRCLVSWTGFWSGYFDHSDLLRPSIPSEWSRKFFFNFIYIFFFFKSSSSSNLSSKILLDRTNQHSSLVGVSKFRIDFLKKSTVVEEKLVVLRFYRNTVPFTGADGLGTPVRALAPGATFG